jgi:hypothetical protein
LPLASPKIFFGTMALEFYRDFDYTMMKMRNNLLFTLAQYIAGPAAIDNAAAEVEAVTATATGQPRGY